MNHKILVALTLGSVLHGGSVYYPPPDSAGGWRSVVDAPDSKFRKVAGMDRAKLDEALEFSKTSTQHGGLVVVRHGWLVYEKYFGRGNRNANPDMASCGKAFTSIACGIMLKEKHDLIPDGLDTKVFNERYLPEAFRSTTPHVPTSALDNCCRCRLVITAKQPRPAIRMDSVFSSNPFRRIAISRWTSLRFVTPFGVNRARATRTRLRPRT